MESREIKFLRKTIQRMENKRTLNKKRTMKQFPPDLTDLHINQVEKRSRTHKNKEIK